MQSNGYNEAAAITTIRYNKGNFIINHYLESL
jgi:hypothetical protein